jgi:hypothetical protein
VSPDEKYVAYYMDGVSLQVKDLASQSRVVGWSAPLATFGGTAWSPTGRELCFGGNDGTENRTGLWIYNLDGNEPAKVLSGQVVTASWSSDRTKLLFALGPPYYEIWAANLDPNVSTTEALGPGQTLDEHFQEMLRLYTRRIEADPQDAYAYSDRAHYYDCLHDREKANADMRRWSAILSGGSSSDFGFGTPRPRRFASRNEAAGGRRVINLPFDCQIVFSVERHENEIQVLCVAFGQKGRCDMKLFEIPVFLVSLVGFGLLPGLDAPPAYADFTFGERVSLGLVNPFLDPLKDGVDCLSYDGLEMHIESFVGPGNWDLQVLRRASIDDDWGPPQNLGPAVNTANVEACSSISADGLTLYFNSNRPGGYGSSDIYMTTRATKGAPWGPAVNLGPKVNGPASEAWPWISADGLELYLSSTRPGGYGDWDFWVTKRATGNDPWGAPVNLGPVVNSPYTETGPCLSPDGLLLVFSDYFLTSSPRPGGYGSNDMWMSRRANLSAPWQSPMNLGPKMNGPDVDAFPRLSPDGRTLYFFTTSDNWQSPIVPIVDFNGDGIVDLKDFSKLGQYWGQNESSVDMGPTPLGDGIVDIRDVAVLAEYWLKEPGLIAYWKLDEKMGLVAHDRTGNNDAFLMTQDPLWRPDGGQVKGALEFDGVDDYISTPFIFNPANGAFSVFAWIKGNTPGRGILCQEDGANWLSTLAPMGWLITGLGAQNGVLMSQKVITDGQWHRVGLTWDGTTRRLYVDDTAVPSDTQTTLPDSSGCLHIGASTGLAPGTFWSGLIDDVRIYDRAVTP